MLRPARTLSLLLLAASPAQGQVGEYGPGPPASAATPEQAPDPCAQPPNGDPDVIVVCKQWESGAAYTFDAPTRADTEVTGSGVPRAPDVFGLPPCSSYTVCQRFGSVPPPAIMIDFASLPETPPDSDAARLYGGPTSDDVVTGGD